MRRAENAPLVWYTGNHFIIDKDENFIEDFGVENKGNSMSKPSRIEVHPIVTLHKDAMGDEVPEVTRKYEVTGKYLQKHDTHENKGVLYRASIRIPKLAFDKLSHILSEEIGSPTGSLCQFELLVRIEYTDIYGDDYTLFYCEGDTCAEEVYNEKLKEVDTTTFQKVYEMNW